MHQKLSRDHFWPGMNKDISYFCKQCRICSLMKPKYISAHLKPYLQDVPMQLIAVDYIGSLPSSKGFRYILVIVDCFSRFPEIFPGRDLSTKTLIGKFRQFFSNYGFPDAIISDRGRAYSVPEQRIQTLSF